MKFYNIYQILICGLEIRQKRCSRGSNINIYEIIIYYTDNGADAIVDLYRYGGKKRITFVRKRKFFFRRGNNNTEI